MSRALDEEVNKICDIFGFEASDLNEEIIADVKDFIKEISAASLLNEDYAKEIMYAD